MKKILIPLIITASLIIVFFLLFGEMESSFAELLSRFKDNPSRYASLSFIILVSDIVLPVPSSIVMYLNGFFLGVPGGFFLSIVSVNCSAAIGYYLGGYSSKLLKSKPDDYGEELMERYGHFAVLMTRGIPILSESICIVCGYNRYNFKTYLILNLIGYIPVCLIYAYFGSVGGNQNQFLLSFGASLLVSFLLWLFGKNLIDKTKTET